MTARSRALVAAVIAVIATVLPATAGRAADNGLSSIQPAPRAGSARPAFELTGRPGSTISDQLVLTNKTRSPLTFDLYSADAYDDPNGAFVLRGENEQRRDVGAWVRLPAHHLTVPAHAAFTVPFTVHVPGNAVPGDHAGGVVALSRAVSRAAPGAGGNVGVRQGVGVRIYARIAGKLAPALAITGLRYRADSGIATWFGAGHRGTVDFRVENTGNVRLSPTAAVKIAALNTVRSGTLHVPELLPGGSAPVHVQLDGVHGAGYEHATAVVTASATRASASATEFVAPYALVGVIVIVLVLLVLWWWWRRRTRRRRAGRRGAPRTTAPTASESPAPQSGRDVSAPTPAR